MIKYKIDDFLKLDLKNFLDKEILISMPQIRCKGKIVNIYDGFFDKYLVVRGIINGYNYLGKHYFYEDTKFNLNLTNLKKNYKQDNIQIIVNI